MTKDFYETKKSLVDNEFIVYKETNSKEAVLTVLVGKPNTISLKNLYTIVDAVESTFTGGQYDILFNPESKNIEIVTTPELAEELLLFYSAVFHGISDLSELNAEQASWVDLLLQIEDQQIVKLRKDFSKS